jgi:hypothetical protein
VSVRRRRIKERVEREKKRNEQSERFHHSLLCVQRAIDDAIARGDKIVTPRVQREINRRLLAVRTSPNTPEK